MRIDGAHSFDDDGVIEKVLGPSLVPWFVTVG